MTDLFCGIDFGTSNSTVSLADSRRAWLIDLEPGQPTMPSAVFWDAEGQPEFGREALAAYMRGDDGRLLRGLKSALGSNLIDERTRLGNRAVSFRDVILHFFGQLQRKLDAVAPGIDHVVLGRPVHFHDNDSPADAKAQLVLADIARSLGFREVAFQYEPIAAALHYEQTVTQEELVLVVDIGGGTSDFSILRVGPDRAGRPDRSADILASYGIRLGGTDFDRLLSLAEVMPHLGYLSGLKSGAGTMPRHYYLDLATWHRINFLYNARVEADLKALMAQADRPELISRMARVVQGRAGHRIAMAVEAAKIALSDVEETPVALASIIGGPDPLVRRVAFEAVVTGAAERIHSSIGSVLEQAGLTVSDIGTVFMTGGASGLPIVQRMVAQALPGTPIATGDMLGSVGSGLALDARRRFG